MKYFFISMFGTAIFVALILQVPNVRHRVISELDRLAEWHEKGTANADVDLKVKPQYWRRASGY